MKLNIGSSEPRKEYIHKPWINLDSCRIFRNLKNKKGRAPNNFVVADGCQLPFKDNCFDEVRAIHVLEHIEKDFHIALMQEIKRVLKTDGVAWVEVPDFLETCYKILTLTNFLDLPNTSEQIDDIKELIRISKVSIYGKGRYEGDSHRWGFSPGDIELLAFKAELKATREYSFFPSSHHTIEPVLLYKVVHGQ